jgi:riboflavin kinase/FMN adenylyltransferase
MTILRYSLNDTLPADWQGGVLTLGNFDGVHLGHQALLAETAKQAQAFAGPAVAATFDPSPAQLLRPDLYQPTLTTIEDRAELMHAQGIDHVLIFHTSPDLLQLTAREFFDRILIEQLRVRALVEGFNFAFGRGREGTIEVLRGFAEQAGVGFTLVPPLEVRGQAVSSSRLRAELLQGGVAEAAGMLGRPYRLAGIVEAGQRRGRTIGFPTANLHRVSTLIPGNGVYAVRAWHRGVAWPAAANIGPNPTFGEQARKLEIHLIGFQGDLYDQPLAIDFLAKIRDVRPFARVDELIAQIRADVAAALAIVALELS